MSVILVTGATGRIGSLVANKLVELNHAPRVFVRDVDKAVKLLAPEVEIVVGDLADQDAVARAVDGVDRLLLVSPVHPDQRILQGNLARAAASVGKPLIVKISGLGTKRDSYIDSGRWHAETEADIESLGLPYAFLRPNFFMQNLGFAIANCRETGEIRAAVEDARIAMVDVRDIADVCVNLLTGEAELTDGAYALTGPVAYDYVEVAKLLSGLLGRNIAYVQQSLDEARASLEATGQPAWHIEILLQFNRAFRDGWGSEPNDVVARVLGRAPRTLADYLAEAVGRSEANPGSNPFPS